MPGKHAQSGARHLPLLLCAAATMLSVPLGARQPASANAAAALTEVGEVALSPRLRELTFRTPALVTASLGPLPANPNGLTKVRVLLPSGYDPRAPQRYPVLYLYHGGTENFTAWTTPARKGQAEALTEGMPLIVVMPDGGMAGGYADWYNKGAFGAPMWMTYHLEQLIPWIDAHYRTIADRGGRATAGLSMGGGGLRYAAMRPDLIGATASFSGDIDILQPASDWNGMGAPLARLIWGDRKSQEVRWRGASAPDLAANLGNTDVALYAGDTGHPEGLYILPGAKALHDRLQGFRITHAFTVYPGMTHSWPNWNKALADWLPRLLGRFHAYNRGNAALTAWPIPASGPPPKPDRFTYSTIRPSYTTFGWTVRMQRKVAEFSALEVTGSHAFAISGSGMADIETSALAAPGRVLRVVSSQCGEARPGHPQWLKADNRGRLHISLQLGPENHFQQYSSEATAAASGPPTQKTPFPQFDNGSKFCRVAVQIAPGLR